MTGGESANPAFYNSDASTYDARWQTAGGRTTATAQARIVNELLGAVAGEEVVEVGPGTGRFSRIALELGKRLTLVDTSSGMLETARAALVGRANPPRDFVCASIYELPFTPARFDAALSINVFNHLEQPERALQQLARVVRPGGTVIFNYANLASVYWPAGTFVNLRRRAVGQGVFSAWVTPASIRRAIAGAGLRLEQVVGNTHVPRGLDRSPLVPALSWLDRAVRRGPLAAVAPVHFCLCTKPGT